MFHIYLLAFKPQGRDSVRGGMGAEHIAAERLHNRWRKTNLEFPPAPSQLAVESEEKKPTADTLCPVLFLTIEFLAEGRSLEKNVICSCIPEVTEKLKHKMKSSKALGPHFSSNYYQNCQPIQEQPNKANQNDNFLFSIKL